LRVHLVAAQCRDEYLAVLVLPDERTPTAGLVIVTFLNGEAATETGQR